MAFHFAFAESLAIMACLYAIAHGTLQPYHRNFPIPGIGFITFIT
jgi:hypothetical protein